MRGSGVRLSPPALLLRFSSTPIQECGSIARPSTYSVTDDLKGYDLPFRVDVQPGRKHLGREA